MKNPHRGNSVTISKDKYDKLVKAKEMLRCLEDGGVDNWEWYSDSLKPFWRKYYPEDYEDANQA